MFPFTRATHFGLPYYFLLPTAICVRRNRLIALDFVFSPGAGLAGVHSPQPRRGGGAGARKSFWPHMSFRRALAEAYGHLWSCCMAAWCFFLLVLCLLCIYAQSFCPLHCGSLPATACRWLWPYKEIWLIVRSPP